MVSSVQLTFFLLTSVASFSWSAPVAPVGLEAWLYPTTCYDSCDSQWWNLEPAQFESAEECQAFVCGPILAFADITGQDPTALARDDMPMALLEDFIVNCGAMCDAEWWVDGTGLESASHCRRAICTRKMPPKVVEAPSTPDGNGFVNASSEEPSAVVDASTLSVTAALKSGNRSAAEPTEGHTIAETSVPVPEPPAVILKVEAPSAATAPATLDAHVLSRTVRPPRKQAKLAKTTEQLAARATSDAAASIAATDVSEGNAAAAVAAPSPYIALPAGKCYKHATCGATGYCAANMRCLPVQTCSHSPDAATFKPIDGMCPFVNADAAAEAASTAVPMVPLAIQEIKVFSGHFVDQIQILLNNGTVIKYGADGGELQQPPFVVPVGEWITWLKVRQGGNLDSIQFYTNRGTSSKSYGGPGGSKKIFHVSRGNELIGLHRDESGVAQPITGIEEQLHKQAILVHTSATAGNARMSPGSMTTLR